MLLACSRWSVRGLQTEEKLAFAARRIDPPMESLTHGAAELLANMCAQHGRDWFDVHSQVTMESLAETADDLFGLLDEEYEEFVEDIRRQNDDRADLQLKNLDRHLKRQKQQMEEIRRTHLINGRASLAKATEGRMRALEERVERQTAKITGGRKLVHKPRGSHCCCC